MHESVRRRYAKMPDYTIEGIALTFIMAQEVVASELLPSQVGEHAAGVPTGTNPWFRRHLVYLSSHLNAKEAGLRPCPRQVVIRIAPATKPRRMSLDEMMSQRHFLREVIGRNEMTPGIGCRR